MDSRKSWAILCNCPGLQPAKEAGRDLGVAAEFVQSGLEPPLHDVPPRSSDVPPQGVVDQRIPTGQALDTVELDRSTRQDYFASDRVAPGRYQPGAPTDPYVLALKHTVLQIMGSLRAGSWTEKCVPGPVGNAGADDRTRSMSANAGGCGGKATSASTFSPRTGSGTTLPSSPSRHSTRNDRVTSRSTSVAARRS
jgi:hypothetical protein